MLSRAGPLLKVELVVTPVQDRGKCKKIAHTSYVIHPDGTRVALHQETSGMCTRLLLHVCPSSPPQASRTLY